MAGSVPRPGPRADAPGSLPFLPARGRTLPPLQGEVRRGCTTLGRSGPYRATSATSPRWAPTGRRRADGLIVWRARVLRERDGLTVLAAATALFAAAAATWTGIEGRTITVRGGCAFDGQSYCAMAS